MGVNEYIKRAKGVAKDTYNSFEPVGAVDPSIPFAEARPAAVASETPSDRNGETEQPDSFTSVVFGCGLAGWVIAGPFLGFFTAVGGAYAAEHNQGAVGESCRAMGRVAMAAGMKAREERLWCKIKDAFRSIFRSRCSRNTRN